MSFALDLQKVSIPRLPWRTSLDVFAFPKNLCPVEIIAASIDRWIRDLCSTPNHNIQLVECHSGISWTIDYEEFSGKMHIQIFKNIDEYVVEYQRTLGTSDYYDFIKGYIQNGFHTYWNQIFDVQPVVVVHNQSVNDNEVVEREIDFVWENTISSTFDSYFTQDMPMTIDELGMSEPVEIITV